MREYWHKSDYWREKMKSGPGRSLPDSLSPEDHSAVEALRQADFSEVTIAYLFTFRETIENWAYREAGLL